MLLATQQLLGLEDKQLLKAATGLGGGVGHEGDTCGCLTGGILSLGLFHQYSDLNILYGDCYEYYQRFKTYSGSTKCVDIIGMKLNQSHDMYQFFFKGIKCLMLVFNSIKSVFDIIQKTDKISLSKVRYQTRPLSDIKQFQGTSAVLSKIETQLNIDLSSLKNISRGFSGGIAFQGDICGALIGGALALGVVYGTGLHSTKPIRLIKAGLAAVYQGNRIFQQEDLHPSFRASLRVSNLYNGFVLKFRNTNCNEILREAQKYKNINFCEGIVRNTSESTLNIINT